MRWRSPLVAAAAAACAFAIATLGTWSPAWLAGASSGFALTGTPVNAMKTYESSYGFDRTWNAAIRLVRVDMGLKVTEKDEATGYVLFEYRSTESGAKPTPGSIEIVRPREATEPVRVVVQLPQMPMYHEQVLVDSLAKKLRADYGEPPARPRASAAKKETDAGPDAD